MLARQIFERLQAVVYENIALVFHHLFIVHDGIGTTLLQGAFGKAVAVELVAFQGQEDAAFRAVATVGGNDGMLLIKLI